ncbi:response regulator [Pareuzebyella sediminis]|uniref:response regulator n=1 Tax=Pareuzebyella sediminis TaxID=2607998 RepID=UPI0011EBED22|nr:response regulator [Pareuzebyella sediminis]
MNYNLQSYEAVYLIDDEHTTNFLHKVLLKKSGLEADVKTYMNPELALVQLTKDLLAIRGKILVLLDINMPEMTGFEFLRSAGKLLHAKGKIEVLMVTSSIDPMDRERAYRDPLVLGYFEKPLKVSQLTDFLDSRERPPVSPAIMKKPISE